MSDIKNMEKLKKYKSKLSNSTNFEKQKIYIAKINEYTARLNQTGGVDTTSLLADIEAKLELIGDGSKLLIDTSGNPFMNSISHLKNEYTENLKTFAKCKHAEKAIVKRLDDIKTKITIDGSSILTPGIPVGDVDFYVNLLELVDLLAANDGHNAPEKLIEIVNTANNLDSSSQYSDNATTVTKDHIEKVLPYIVHTDTSGYNTNDNSGLQKNALKTAVNTVTSSAFTIDDNSFNQT